MGSSAFDRLVRRAPFHDEGYGYDVFGMHPPALARAVEAGAWIYERYFRVESWGIEHIPAAGPVIVVANHGGVLPVDAAMLCLDILRRTEPPRIPRPVADHFVPRMPLISTLFARVGVVGGARANVRRLLEQGELVVIWPEGVSGPAKPFHARYEIQHWSVGFAELALRYGAPIVPAGVIGAEESWPLVTKLDKLRLFGAPYLPIPASPIPLPAHYRIGYGPPIVLDDNLVQADADDPEVVAAAAALVRRAVEQLVRDARIVRRGMFLR